MTPRKPSNFDNVISIAKKAKPRLKRTVAPRKPKKISISKLQKLLWVECKRIIRNRYGNVCYTCGKTGLVGSDWHTGHFLPKGACGAFLKYDLRNLRPQDYFCNINMGGAGAQFYVELVKREGQAYVDQLFIDKQKLVRAYDHYSMLLEQYKAL